MESIFIIIVLLFSVVIHEISHGYAALALGDHTAKNLGRLTLNPLKHLDPIGSVLVPLIGFMTGGFIIGWAKPVPFNPYNLKNQRWGEALVAIAGPISNILIAIVFALVYRYEMSSNSSFIAPSLVAYIVLINITLAVFNLMPIPPLDGSKILFSLFPNSLYKYREFLERAGLFLVFILIFVIWPFISPIVSKVFFSLIGVAGM